MMMMMMMMMGEVFNSTPARLIIQVTASKFATY